MSGPLEQPPGLLHNAGWAPRASIVWRGFGRGPLSDDAERIEVARGRGTWLRLSLSIGQSDARYHRHWNTAQALLQLVEPGHGLAEPEAAERLKRSIDEHTRVLGWPRCLLVGDRRTGNEPRVTLDHALTTFVALSKSTGSLWLRERTCRLAPLHTPTLIGPGGAPIRGVRWDQLLWFPEGVPADLLGQVVAQTRARQA